MSYNDQSYDNIHNKFNKTGRQVNRDSFNNVGIDLNGDGDPDFSTGIIKLIILSLIYPHEAKMIIAKDFKEFNNFLKGVFTVLLPLITVSAVLTILSSI